jgi:ABC-2 type transport system permease protein
MRPRNLQKAKTIKNRSVPTKMMVIADGDIIHNGLRGHGEETQIVPLGYDVATNQVMFSNKDFLLNAINYLTDDEGWYALRERTIKLRLLDKKELERRQYYRLLNVALPLLFLFLLSIVLIYTRKRRFTK